MRRKTEDAAIYVKIFVHHAQFDYRADESTVGVHSLPSFASEDVGLAGSERGSIHSRIRNRRPRHGPRQRLEGVVVRR